MTATIKSVDRVVSDIAAAEAVTTERDNRDMRIGDVAHQGDVYVCRVEARADVYKFNHLLGSDPQAGLTQTLNRQVAPGVTPGSRHIVVGDAVSIYAPSPGGSPLEGPLVLAEGEWTLTHPEHAPHRFGAGSFVVTFQRDQADEMRRVAD